MAYNVVRFYRDRPGHYRRRVILRGVTLGQAQRHCQDPETSSSTATSAAGKRRTKRYGPWFDGYEECKQ
jgi:hypothetical protein